MVVDTMNTVCQFLAKQTPQKPIQWLLLLTPQVADNLETWFVVQIYLGGLRWTNSV